MEQNGLENKEQSGKYMDEYVDPQGSENLRIKRADLAYLRSGDANFAIGTLTNKTYNIRWNMFSEGLYPCGIGWMWPHYSPNTTLDPNILYYNEIDNYLENLKCNDEDLFFTFLNSAGQNSTKYYMEYYQTSTFPTTYVLEQGRYKNGMLKVKYEFGKYFNNYIVPLKIRRKDLVFPQLQLLEQEVIIQDNISINEIDDNDLTNKIELIEKSVIYPNPIENILSFQLSQDNCRLIIYSSDGRILVNEILRNSIGSIDISRLAIGTYRVEIKFNQDILVNQNIVKL